MRVRLSPTLFRPTWRAGAGWVLLVLLVGGAIGPDRWLGWPALADEPPAWVQAPDLGPTGVEIRVDRGDGGLRRLGDDFQCAGSGRLRQVQLWGAWRSGVRGSLSAIHLRIYGSEEGTPSQPGARLWERSFGPGEFSEALDVTLPSPGGWWWDPASNAQVAVNAREIWRLTLTIPPEDGFVQFSSASRPAVYWLEVGVETAAGEFGLRTRQWPGQTLGGAVFTAAETSPLVWDGLRYPPGVVECGVEGTPLVFDVQGAGPLLDLGFNYYTFPVAGIPAGELLGGRIPPCWRVQVRLALAHQDLSDLAVYLLDPAEAKAIALVEGGALGKNTAFQGTLFDDRGADFVTGAAPYLGTFKPGLWPIDNLDYTGQIAEGAWTLLVWDRVIFDTGTLYDRSTSPWPGVGTQLILIPQVRPPLDAAFRLDFDPVTPPALTLSCPVDPIVPAANLNGAPVTYLATASGGVPPLTVNCTPPSGSTFPIGVTTVQCTATDSIGQTAQCSFTVTVPTPPALTLACPSPLTVPATSLDGAVVTYSTTATGGVPPLTVNYTPPSGSTFPIGVTTVQCTATDSIGQTAQCSFTVTVPTPPALTLACPSPLTVPATSLDGAVATYSTTATGGVPPVNVNYTPPSGSTFPVGVTTVQCTATDSIGQTAQCSFTVTVPAPPALTLACPSPLTVPATSVDGAVATYSTTATGGVPPVTVNCTPTSGSTFPIGVTTVQCTATDSIGQTAQCSLDVTVTPAASEVDRFDHTLAAVRWELPSGEEETVYLSGAMDVRVWIDPAGSAVDRDGNGRDQVPTELAELRLAGASTTQGAVTVRLHATGQTPFQRSEGQLEELIDTVTGRLDVPPYAAAGGVDSRFDVFLEVAIGGATFHATEPVRLEARLRHRTPQPAEAYLSALATPVALLEESGTPADVRVLRVVIIPDARLTTRAVPEGELRLVLPNPATGVRLQRTLALGLDAVWTDVVGAAGGAVGTSAASEPETVAIDTSAGTAFYRYYLSGQ